MLLFVLQLEPLMENIRQNPQICPYEAPGGQNLKNLSYADDNMFILPHPADRVHLETELDQFCAISGAKVNADKTEAVAIGYQDYIESVKIQIPADIRKPTVRFLGVLVSGYNQHQRNWDRAIGIKQG